MLDAVKGCVVTMVHRLCDELPLANSLQHLLSNKRQLHCAECDEECADRNEHKVKCTNCLQQFDQVLLMTCIICKGPCCQECVVSPYVQAHQCCDNYAVMKDQQHEALSTVVARKHWTLQHRNMEHEKKIDVSQQQNEQQSEDLNSESEVKSGLQKTSAKSQGNDRCSHINKASQSWQDPWHFHDCLEMVSIQKRSWRTWIDNKAKLKNELGQMKDTTKEENLRYGIDFVSKEVNERIQGERRQYKVGCKPLQKRNEFALRHTCFRTTCNVEGCKTPAKVRVRPRTKYNAESWGGSPGQRKLQHKNKELKKRIDILEQQNNQQNEDSISELEVKACLQKTTTKPQGYDRLTQINKSSKYLQDTKHVQKGLAIISIQIESENKRALTSLLKERTVNLEKKLEQTEGPAKEEKFKLDIDSIPNGIDDRIQKEQGQHKSGCKRAKKFKDVIVTGTMNEDMHHSEIDLFGDDVKDDDIMFQCKRAKKFKERIFTRTLNEDMHHSEIDLFGDDVKDDDIMFQDFTENVNQFELFGDDNKLHNASASFPRPVQTAKHKCVLPRVPPPGLPSHPPPSPPPSLCQVVAAALCEQKASCFEKKLTEMLFNLSATQAKIKLEMILQNLEHYSRLSGMSEDSLKAYVDGLMHDFREDSTHLLRDDAVQVVDDH